MEQFNGQVGDYSSSKRAVKEEEKKNPKALGVKYFFQRRNTPESLSSRPIYLWLFIQ